MAGVAPVGKPSYVERFLIIDTEWIDGDGNECKGQEVEVFPDGELVVLVKGARPCGVKPDQITWRQHASGSPAPRRLPAARA